MKPGLFQIKTAAASLSLVCLPFTFAAQNPAEAELAGAPAQAQSDFRKSIEEYEQEIRKREAEHGVYDPATGEYLLSVGLVYQNNGQQMNAVDAFSAAFAE